eukprot:TRINITY_DN4794_c0_g1_i1.p1 TRINITY_DN4794_c0_g1~~TRINITY_DN4794_c0_g1_i1.p1  ORF type:complete len:366 (-),score=29.53 TRINITY_DN4794_c0_g1_i1:176-1225(-)
MVSSLFALVLVGYCFIFGVPLSRRESHHRARLNSSLRQLGPVNFELSKFLLSQTRSHIFGLHSSWSSSLNASVWYFTHRSCSQDLTAPCNTHFKHQIESACAEANKTHIPQNHTYTYFGLPDAIMKNPKWTKYVEPKLRGRGFWFWKPVLVNMLLQDEYIGVKENDVIIYTDADVTGMIKDFTQVVEESPGNQFDVVVARHPYCENTWTKGDIFKEFGVDPDGDPHYAKTMQYMANNWAIRVNSKTRLFMQHWEDLVAQYHLVSDEPSESPNAMRFKENRHDQSLFSMLIKASLADNDLCVSCDKEDYVLLSDKITKVPWTLHERYGIPDFNVVKIRTGPTCGAEASYR